MSKIFEIYRTTKCETVLHIEAETEHEALTLARTFVFDTKGGIPAASYETLLTATATEGSFLEEPSTVFCAFDHKNKYL